tara:strand:+ start:13658 stop:13828 length:171 start_codon:yes stop_codon:yes gene_type:complete
MQALAWIVLLCDLLQHIIDFFNYMHDSDHKINAKNDVKIIFLWKGSENYTNNFIIK